jgi:hypothetical protein
MYTYGVVQTQIRFNVQQKDIATNSGLLNPTARPSAVACPAIDVQPT